MSDYSRSNDFSVKDGLSTGNPNKLIKGSEVDAEFDAIVTMSTTKANKVVPSAAGNLATLSASGDLQDSGSAGVLPSGTKMLFQQTAAPTGWTKDTTHNNKALRVVSGSVSSGGSDDFTTVFASSKTSDAITLSDDNIEHFHYTIVPSSPNSASIGTNSVAYQDNGTYSAGDNKYILRGQTGTPTAGKSSGVDGGSVGSRSSFTVTVPDMELQYVDLIIATKD